MKIVLFVAAVTFSSMALAQSTTPDTSASEPAAQTTPGSDPNGPGVPPGDGITQQGTDPQGQASAPPGTNEPFTPPPGAVAVPPTGQGAAFTPQPATTDYPPCSRTVTDRCIQTYERGVRRPA